MFTLALPRGLMLLMVSRCTFAVCLLLLLFAELFVMHVCLTFHMFSPNSSKQGNELDTTT